MNGENCGEEKWAVFKLEGFKESSEKKGSVQPVESKDATKNCQVEFDLWAEFLQDEVRKKEKITKQELEKEIKVKAGLIEGLNPENSQKYTKDAATFMAYLKNRYDFVSKESANA